MAEQYEASSAHRTRRPRWERASAESRAQRTHDRWDDRSTPRQNLGPYETRYEVSHGYGKDRVILTP
jgi:hypothetical protein